ncbi:MAG: DMT family transporter [Opitutales bacterium]
MLLPAAPIRRLHPGVKAGLIACIALVAGFCYIGILRGLEHGAPLRFASLRVLIAGVAILLAAGVLRKPLFPAPRRRVWVLPLGLVATALTFGAMFLTPQFTGAGLASVLGNLQPLFVVVLAGLLLGERLTLARMTALALGLTGVSLIAVGSFASSFGPGAGIAIALLSSASAAVGTVLIKYLAPGEDWLALAGWQLLAGGGILFAASLSLGEPASHWSLSFIGILAFLALGETAFVTVLWFWLLRRSEAGPLAINLFFVPVVGLLLAVLIEGERLTATVWMGAAIVLAGIGAGILGESRASGGPRNCVPKTIHLPSD